MERVALRLITVAAVAATVGVMLPDLFIVTWMW